MFQIGNRKIGKGFKPFIVAELSANHGGNIQRAKDTILAAKKSGADAIKIQTYTPDTMTIDSTKQDFLIKEGLWKGYNLYKLYQEAYTPFEWHKDLFEFAKSHDILIFSTPFDESAVDLLFNLNVPAFKVASFELTDLPLINYIASKGKPILLSTGMSNESEIAEALDTCYQAGNKDVLLFHCISNYPTDLKDTNLGDISYIAKYFNVEVGLSDHTTSNLASILAIAQGASAIEKHFKLDNTDCGPDSSFSLVPEELKRLCVDCNLAFEALKSSKLQRGSSELKNKQFRRSIYFINDLKKGEQVTIKDIKRIRPGHGLEPKYFNSIIGRILKCDVERGDPVSFKAFTKG